MNLDVYKIYVVTNRINGKQYVGQTVGGVLKRWTQHKSAARTKRKLHFHAAINKYGETNFGVEQVAWAFSKAYCDQLEEAWIRTLRTHEREFGYNSTFGGEGARHIPETKAKLSAAKKGKPGHKRTPEQSLAAGARQAGEKAWNWGRRASEETRQKMSAIHSGPNNPMFGLFGENHPAFGIKHSEESKKVRSEKLSGEKNPMFGKIGELSPTFGRKATAEQKAKLSASAKLRTGEKNPFYGRKHTPETRAKMKATRTAKREEKLAAERAQIS